MNRRHAYGQCYGCLRPRVDCFCEEIPRIANQTNILILQHRRERRHRFNTVRITERALLNSHVMIGYTEEFASAKLPIQSGAGLLYPGPTSRCLTDVVADELTTPPTQLVILDGTWHHTKTFLRDIAVLRALPRFSLAPAAPSRYRIREEPNQQSLSTLEATAAALEILEPSTVGTAQLLKAFDRMVEGQLANPFRRAALER